MFVGCDVFVECECEVCVLRDFAFFLRAQFIYVPAVGQALLMTSVTSFLELEAHNEKINANVRCRLLGPGRVHSKL